MFCLKNRHIVVGECFLGVVGGKEHRKEVQVRGTSIVSSSFILYITYQQAVATISLFLSCLYVSVSRPLFVFLQVLINP